MKQLKFLIHYTLGSIPNINIIKNTFDGELSCTFDSAGRLVVKSTYPEFNDAFSPQDQTKCKSRIGGDYDLFVNCEDDYILIQTEPIEDVLSYKMIEVYKSNPH